MSEKFEIVSHEYYSNCLFEAVKAKLRDPRIRLYFCRPRITENGRFQMFHFMWGDGKADYDFSDLGENWLPPWQNLFFKGAVRKFPAGFAAKYTEYRNMAGGKKIKQLSSACIKYILIVILWQALEMVFYGAVQHRVVDDIIGVILFWYIYQREKSCLSGSRRRRKD